jgi:hypothetical protein
VTRDVSRGEPGRQSEPVEPRVVRNTLTPYYQDAAVTLYCADNREVLPTLEAVDHVITDPPYEAEAHTEGRRIKTKGGGGQYGETGSLVLDFEPITPELRAYSASEMARLARRWVLVFCQVEAVAQWRDVLFAGGLSYRRACAWRSRNYQAIVQAWATSRSSAPTRRADLGGTAAVSAACMRR